MAAGSTGRSPRSRGARISVGCRRSRRSGAGCDRNAMNLAIVTGAVSGVVVVDLDSLDGWRYFTPPLSLHALADADRARVAPVLRASGRPRAQPRAHRYRARASSRSTCAVMAATSSRRDRCTRRAPCMNSRVTGREPREALPRFWPGWLARPTRPAAPAPLRRARRVTWSNARDGILRRFRDLRSGTALTSRSSPRRVVSCADSRSLRRTRCVALGVGRRAPWLDARMDRAEGRARRSATAPSRSGRSDDARWRRLRTRDVLRSVRARELRGSSPASLGRGITHAPRLRALNAVELPGHRFEYRKPLLYRGDTPVFREGQLLEIYALRGVGKSYLARTLAHVAAHAGCEALGFRSEESVRVLDVDGGEIAGPEIQERDGIILHALGIAPSSNLVTVAADWRGGWLPRLDTAAGRLAIEPFVATADLIILDNRSSLLTREAERSRGVATCTGLAAVSSTAAQGRHGRTPQQPAGRRTWASQARRRHGSPDQTHAA